MGAFTDLLMEHLAPGLGVIIALMMFSSPLHAVMQLQKTECLGDLNPLPYVLIMANCAGWVGYSLTNGDLYVFMANGPGFLIGSYLVFTAYPYASKKQRQTMLCMFLFFAALLNGLAIGGVKVVESGEMDLHGLQQLWGLAANFNLICYYAAPLSTLYTVVQTRNSASIHLPLSVCAAINATLWTIYGTAKKDMYIAVPNGVGLGLAVLQMALRATFPARSGDSNGGRGFDPEDANCLPAERKRLMDGRTLSLSNVVAHD